MLKELFEGHFYGTFARKQEVVLRVDEQTYVGAFSLLDINACIQCHYVCSPNAAIREQLKIAAQEAVNVINLDQVFSYVEENVGEICDYMIDGTQTVVLIEMTCSTSDYVKDKRQKARRQLYNSLTLLHTSPIIRDYIIKKSLRYVIFSWRETYDPKIADSVIRSMTGMMEMSDGVYSAYNESEFDFGFRWREIRYPDVFVI